MLAAAFIVVLTPLAVYGLQATTGWWRMARFSANTTPISTGAACSWNLGLSPPVQLSSCGNAIFDLIAFWGGLGMLRSDGEWNRSLYLGVNLTMIGVGLLWLDATSGKGDEAAVWFEAVGRGEPTRGREKKKAGAQPLPCYFGFLE